MMKIVKISDTQKVVITLKFEPLKWPYSRKLPQKIADNRMENSANPDQTVPLRAVDLGLYSLLLKHT